jgi:hypothetical protein
LLLAIGVVYLSVECQSLPEQQGQPERQAAT